MKYAIIKSGGKQYKVLEGDVIEVDKLKNVKNGKVLFDQVLLSVSDDDLSIGKPFISGVGVEAKVIGDFKGKKIRVSKYKAKVRYRRVMGFRASLTKVQIEKIGGSRVEKLKTAKAKKVSK